MKEQVKREKGYYWLRIKRTKIWIIAYWMPSLNNGKGFWDIRAFENDTRGGFDLIIPQKLNPPPVNAKPKRARTKRVRTKRVRTR